MIVSPIKLIGPIKKIIGGLFFILLTIALSGNIQAQEKPAINPDEPVRNGNISGNVTNGKDSEGNPAGTPQNATSAPGFSDRAISRDRNAPRRINLQAFKLVNHVNALVGGFETGAGFGFGVEFTTADSLPGIELRAKLLGSTRLYRRFEAEAYFPKILDEKNHASVWFNYQKRTRDNFFGIGPRTAEDPETNFASDQRSYNFSLWRDFTSRLQAGLYLQMANTDAFAGSDKEDKPLDLLFSPNRTVKPPTRYAPGLNTNAKIFSYGVFAELDGRDNKRGLTKGAYLYARAASFDSLQNGPFSDFGWHETELDGRVYIPLRSDFTSLALRAFTELKAPKGGSQIPFYDLSWLGGRNHHRGFRNFRFRANKLLMFSVEPRQTIWKQKETKGLDIFVFGDAGQVWGDNRSTLDPQILANNKFDSKNWRFATGGGLQYRWNKSVAVRLEVGHSNETNMVFFSVSRGF